MNSHFKIADLGFAKAVLKESERSCLSGTDGFGFEEKEMQAFFGNPWVLAAQTKQKNPKQEIEKSWQLRRKT